MPDRVDAGIGAVQASCVGEPLDARTRISQELLKLADRDDAVLPSSELRQLPPSVRSTCVNRPRAWSTCVTHRFTQVDRVFHGVTKVDRGSNLPPRFVP
jgi:hypothetical protein